MKTTNMKKAFLASLAALTLLTAALPAAAQGNMKAPNNSGVQMQGRGGKGRQMQGMPDLKQNRGIGNPGQVPDGGVPQEGQLNGQTQNPTMRGFGRGGRNGQKGGRGLAALGALVRDGVISQETFDKIMDARKTQGFDKLLEDGLLTQEEYDAIKKYIEEKNPAAANDNAAPDSIPSSDDTPEAMDPELEALVESGVITQEQADAIIAARAAKAAPQDASEAEADLTDTSSI